MDDLLEAIKEERLARARDKQYRALHKCYMRGLLVCLPGGKGQIEQEDERTEEKSGHEDKQGQERTV